MINTIIGLFIAYHLAFGGLLPLSPIKLGWKETGNEKIKIYYIHDTQLNCTTDSVARLLPKVEHQIGKSFTYPIIIYLCDTTDRMKNIIGMDSRMATSMLNPQIFVSPVGITLSQRDNAAFLKLIQHELTHVLMFQNMSILENQTYPDWILEGVATLNGQHAGIAGYPDKRKTAELMARGYFIDPEDYTMPNEKDITRNHPTTLDGVYRHCFYYSEFAFFIEKIQQDFGLEKFQQFIWDRKSSGDTLSSFEKIFGQSYGTYILEYKKQMTQLVEDPHP